MGVPRDSQRFSNEVLRNARTILYVGRQLGASNRDILIALMTGWQESGLRNLNWGDRDSVGVFQQRAGWGSLSQRMNVAESARMFFRGGHKPGTPGLLDNDRRGKMSLSAAAQWVQRSAFPDAYAKWERRSRDLLGELGSAVDEPERSQASDSLVDTSLLPSNGESTKLADLGDQKLSALSSEPDRPLGLASADAPGSESADVMPNFDNTPMGLAPEALLPDLERPSQTTVQFDNSAADQYTGKRGNYNLPRVQPWVVDAANEVGGKFGIKSIGGYGHRANKTEHDDGLALDFMTKGPTGNALAAYVQANAKRLGVTYVIWNQRIWSVARANEGWRIMKDRGSPTANHMDHVHVSFAGR